MTNTSERSYQFEELSEAPPEYGFFGSLELNDTGDGVFEGFKSTNGLPEDILDFQKQVGTVPLEEVSAATDLTFQPAINNRDQVSFATVELDDAFQVQYSSVVRYDSFTGNYTTIADTSDFATLGLTDINDRGEVAFYATRSDGSSGIYRGDGEILVEIASSNDEFSNFQPNYAGLAYGRGDGPFGITTYPSLNKNDEVAFSANLDAGGFGVFVGDGYQLETIVNTSSNINNDYNFTGIGSVELNDRGELAFLASYDLPDDGKDELFGTFKVGRNGDLDLIASSTDKYNNFLSDPALNNQGDIVFLATTDAGDTALFTDAGNHIISVGDTLADKTVVGLSANNNALNDRDQIGFSVFFNDGSQDIYLASPIV